MQYVWTELIWLFEGNYALMVVAILCIVLLLVYIYIVLTT